MNNKELINEFLNYYYFRNNKNISKQSLRVYSNKIKKIYELLNIFEVRTTNIFLDFKKMKLFLENNFENINSRSTYLSAMIIWMKANQIHADFVKPYQEYLFELSNKKKNIQKIKMEKENKISKDEIGRIRYDFLHKISYIDFEKIKMKDKKILQNYLLFLFYSGIYIAPCRNNLNSLLVLDEFDESASKEFNFICLKTKQIIYRKFKTNKTHGDIKVKIPEEFMELILLIKDDIMIDNFLFKNLNTKKCIKNGPFGKKIQRIFNGASINDLRHLYLTEKYSVLKPLIKELVEDTRCMGNSVNVALTHYIHDTIKEIETQS